MTKRIFFGAALALTLAGGAVAANVAPAVAVAPAAAQVASAPVAAAAVAQDAAAVQLTAAQMATVQGAGIFSIFKDLWKSVKKAIAGAIVSFFTNLFKSWIEQIFGVADGGQKEQKTQTVTENYNSQSDYDNGIVASTSTYEEPTWTVTESWSGSCGGGSTDGTRFHQYEMIQAEVSSC